MKCSSIERSSEPSNAHNGAVSLEKAHRTVINLGELTDHTHTKRSNNDVAVWMAN